MRGLFTFNQSKYDYWPIYEAIKKYYPIGIKRSVSQDLYLTYPGIKEIDSIVTGIHSKDNFHGVWTSFTANLTTEFSLKVSDTTYGQAPSYSLDLILETFEDENLIRNKKLSLSVSLLGPFFTIYGVDETIFKESAENGQIINYHAFNALTVSPYREFEQPFEKLITVVKKTFQDYRFVPFRIHAMILPGLEVIYLDIEECDIYIGLFNHFLNTYDYRKKVRGDQSFGANDWLNDDYDENLQLMRLKPQ